MTRRYAVGAFTPATQRPAPTYPEYEQLLADAEAAVIADGRFADSRKMHRVRELRRSWEWKVCVLGHDGVQTLLDVHLLLLADERDLNPPTPQWLLDTRREQQEHADALAAARASRETLDQAASDEAAAGCAVGLVVRRNGHARARHGVSHHLGHFVPAVDAYSGFGRARRRHRAGRGLCESEARAKPLDLSGGEGGPATCVNCLSYAPRLRPASV
jgi:hypothetical protein